MALTTAQVTADYADILFDTANHTNDIAFYVAASTANPTTYTASYVANTIAASTETAIVDYVYSLYSSVLGVTLSNATASGLSYWVKAAEGLSAQSAANTVNGVLSQTAINFLDQSFINAAGTALASSPSALVSQLYLQALGVASPAASGVSYWVSQYNSWVSTLGQAQAEISLINSFANAAATNNAATIQSWLSSGALSDTGTGPTYGTVTPVVSGPTYVLTTGVDTITATAANATFVADNTAAQVASIADSITGIGTGNTLKYYVASAGTTTLPQLAAIQSIYLNAAAVTGATNLGLDVHSLSSVTSLQLDQYNQTSGAETATLTLTGATQAVTISNDNGSNINAIVLKYQSSDTAATVTLNGVGTSGTAASVDVNAGGVATLNLVANTAKSYITLSNTATGLATLNVTGDHAISIADGLTGLKTVSATGDAGGLTLDTHTITTAAAFAFTGGAGVNTLILTDASLVGLNAGSQLNGGTGSANVLEIYGNHNFTAASGDYAALNATTGFQVLNLQGGDSIDDSQLTASFANHIATQGAETISNLANNITIDVLGAGNSTFAPAVGSNTLTLNIGNASSGGIAVGTETITGLTTINLSSNGTSANSVTFVNSDNSLFNVTGSDGLTLTLATGTATGSKVDAHAFTGALTLTDSSKGDVILGGSGTTLITETGAGDTITLLSGHTSVDTVKSFATNYSTTAFDVVNNFVLGQDVLKNTAGALSAGAELSATSGVISSAAYSSAAAFIAAAEGLATGVAKDAVVWYDSAHGNTWVAEFGSAATNSAHIVELVGVHATGIAASAATGTIVIA
jgi:hypothetical protein